MSEIKRKVRDLQPGDYLPATKRTVVSVSRGVKTPARKHDVWLRIGGMVLPAVQWLSDTYVQIERKEAK